jgi:phosphoribosyl-dephospho-CoA transferase
MQPLSEIVRPQIHDLLQLHPDSLHAACMGAPSWVRQSLASCPWVVVRRAEAPAGQLAVGVRGTSRSERWGAFVGRNLITRVVSPAELLVVASSSAPSLQTPPFKALQQLIERWRDLALPWGPTGSLGFELATGCPVTNSSSDLDIAIRAPHRIAVEQIQSLWDRAIGLQTRVDIRVETGDCGFSLEEYASTSTEILLRYPDGARLGNDPWAKGPQAAESTL